MGRLTFLAPIAGLIAAGIGVFGVLVMYMLRLRRRPVGVSSTLLWSRAIKDMEGNMPWQRLSPTVLLWLHLLIVLLLAMAIGRPVMDRGIGDGQRVFVLIDTTASMNAIVDGKFGGGQSGLDRAKAQAVDRVRQLFDAGRLPKVTVIDAGMQPVVLITDSIDRGRVISEINGIDGSDQPGKISDAIELVESMIEASGDGVDEEQETQSHALVWVMSDGGSFDGGQVAMRGGVGVSISPYDSSTKRDGNVGIVALSATRDRSEPELCRVFVRVGRSLVDRGRGVVVRLRVDGDLLASNAIVFEGDELFAQTSFEIRLLDDVLVEVGIDGDDALRIDNRAWVRVPSAQPIRVVVVAPDGRADQLLVDMLEVVARSGVRVIAEGGAIGDADCVVYDRVSPSRLAGVATIGFGSVMPDQPRSDLIVDGVPKRRLSLWDRENPMMKDSSTGSISYRRSAWYEGVSDEDVLARDRDGAVIIVRTIDGVRHVRVGFALQDSDWAVQVGFPIFLINALEYVLPGVDGVGEVYTTSRAIETEGGAQVVGDVGVVEIDGRVFGVGLLDADESALGVRDGVLIGSDDDGSSATRRSSMGSEKRSIWRWLVLGGLGLMTIEWLGYARKVSR